MAGKRERQNGTWEYIFKRKGLLESPVYFTFDTEAEGDAYAERAEALLAKGIIPVEMLSGRVKTLGDLCTRYEEAVPMVRSEANLLPTIRNLVGSVRIEKLTYSWVEAWVDQFKSTGRAPSTISKRVSGLARVVDWAMRRNMVSFEKNPLRMLPRGYCSNGLDRNKVWEGERNRRLEPGEEEAIRKVLKGPWEPLLFDIALETAMRLSEIFTLRCSDIDLKQRTIFLHRSKNGSRRQIPISSVLLKLLEAQDLTQEYLFHEWWQGGTDTQRDVVSKRITHAFARRFKAAGCPDFHFHDTRHEATSRLYERTNLTDLQVASITGHKGFRMLQRYANLRGSTLVASIW